MFPHVAPLSEGLIDALKQVIEQNDADHVTMFIGQFVTLPRKGWDGNLNAKVIIHGDHCVLQHFLSKLQERLNSEATKASLEHYSNRSRN